MKRMTLLAAAFIVSGTMASAAVTADSLIADFTAQGFTTIEVRNGLSQIKVEGIRGGEKVEVVYDRATGNVLKRETEAVRPGDDIRPGVSVRNRDGDFVESDDMGSSDDDLDDDSNNDDANDDAGSDDQGDDSGDDDSGSDGSDDDHGGDGDSGSDDDHGGNDDSGSDGNDDDHGGDDDSGSDGSDDDHGGDDDSGSDD